MCRIESVSFFLGYCEVMVIIFGCFSLLSCILGIDEKRREHFSFLAFETNFREQAHCDNKKKTDACTSHPVDIVIL